MNNKLILLILVSSIAINTAAATFTATGTVGFEEINGTIYPLENANVVYDDTHFDTTDAAGAYSIADIPDGTQTLSVNKSEAFNTSSGTVSGGSPTADFLLAYAKPLMGAPYVSGSNTIYGTYSHNIYPITLWNNPVYIWGEYRYDDLNGTAQDKPYYKTCSYISGSIFECPKDANRAYTFRFIYSDKWNNDLTSWHPSLTGSRNFSSPYLYVSSGSAANLGIKTVSGSAKTTKQKEKLIELNFWDAALATFFLLMIFVLGGINDRSK